MTPSSIISGIPPTSDATTGRDSAIASRMDRPWASRQDGSTATSSAGGDRRDVVAAAGEDHPVGDAVGRGPLLEEVAPRALADDQQVRVRAAPEDVRPGLDQRLVALLRLEPGDDADDRASPAPCPYSSRSGAAVCWSNRWRSTPL